MSYCMIEVAFDNKKIVNKTIEHLLKEKLVSSVQVVESDSQWLFKGKLETAKEYLLFIKTKKKLSKEIYQVVKKYHNYEVFEFAMFDLYSHSKEYMDWIENETK